MKPIPGIFRGLLAAAFLGVTRASVTAQIAVKTVFVGHPGNPVDTNGRGSVSYTFEIGRFETTIEEYTAFLNAVAKDDPHGLYNANMADDGNVAGIQRTGSPGSYVYSVMGNGQRPITYVSWFDAARFANWLHNGQPSGAQTA